MRYLKGSDWDDLRERYPAAYNFLLNRELKNEYEALKFESGFQVLDPRRRSWIEKRLSELERLECV